MADFADLKHQAYATDSVPFTTATTASVWL